MKLKKVIISGGGTGGHIYPAIAIANELKRRNSTVDILFVGARDRMEMQKVPKAGYPIKGLWISGIQRKLTLKNLMFPFKIVSSLWKSYQIVKEFKPQVAIGTGGFASGPLLKAAGGLGIPTVLQEQNSFPGITNKWLAGKAKLICVAYDGMERFFPKDKISKTGNPVREDLLTVAKKVEEAKSYFKLDTDKKTILIIGGSLGARRINQFIEKKLSLFASMNVQLIWQCGSLYFSDYIKHAENKHVQVFQFIDRMDLAYAAADVIISRAGASSVSELCIVGKPVIFIPSPNVAEDHQTKNAEAIVKDGAAKMIKEKDLDQKFENELTQLLEDESLRNRFSIKMKEMALPEATRTIVDQIEKILEK